jgi:hypothetical protein
MDEGINSADCEQNRSLGGSVVTTFKERFLVVPEYRACRWCREFMPKWARLALLGRLMGWSNDGTAWSCPEHRPPRNAEEKEQLDAKLAERRRMNAERESEINLDLGIVRPPFEPEATRAFSHVVVIAEESAFPMAEMLEQKLIRQIGSNPRFPLAAGVIITSMHAPELPAESKSAVEPVVWSLQQRFSKRGGRWETEFYPTPLGTTFLVVYLE